MTVALSETGLSSPTRRYIKYLQTFIFGPYKSGKTVAAHAMPRTRTIDLDGGMQSVEWAIRKGLIPGKKLSDIAYKTMTAEGFKDKGFMDAILDQVWKWIEEEDIPDEKWDRPYPKLWDTLIIDSMTPVNDSSIVLALSENNRLGLSKSWDSYKDKALTVRPARIQDFGSAASLTQQFIGEVRKLPKNLVVLAHERIDTDDDGAVRSVQPALVGQARMTVPAMFDEVWYAQVEGNRNDPKFSFQTVPDKKHKCGSRLGCFDNVQEADFAAMRKMVSEFYEVDEALIWTAAHGKAGVEAAMLAELEEEGYGKKK